MTMFNANEFIKKTIKGMIGNYPDFQAREYALDWWKLGKLSDDDMVEIEALIEAQYIESPVVEESQTETEIVEDSTNEEVIEEPLEETTEDETTE